MSESMTLGQWIVVLVGPVAGLFIFLCLSIYVWRRGLFGGLFIARVWALAIACGELTFVTYLWLKSMMKYNMTARVYIHDYNPVVVTIEACMFVFSIVVMLHWLYDIVNKALDMVKEAERVEEM